jgi:RNA polymerase sigma-70 factor (ECF subfamily)
LQYARAIVGCTAEAEDIVQAVFCKVLQLPRAEVERVTDPASWLAQIARREAINRLRSRRRDRARRQAAHALRLTGGHRGPHDAELGAAIERLPRRLREIVVLKHVNNLTFEQIASATGVNRNTAAARYRSGIALLRSELDAACNPGVPEARCACEPVGQEASHVR